MNRHLKIGILGCRGIPNRYGGYEQFVQHLAPGLVARGHQVWVYQSSLHPYRKESWEGVRLLRQYDPENRLGSSGQFIYDYFCLQDARRRAFDVLLQLGYTSSVIWRPLWPKDAVNIIHMDGLEWQRAKYNRPVRLFLQWMEGRAARHGEVLVADSLAIQAYLDSRYGRPSVYIPYGAPNRVDPQPGHLDRLALQPGQYFLAVARLVPENNLEEIIKGYLESQSTWPLVMVGSTDSRFGQYLARRYRHPAIHLVGGLFDQEELNSLRFFCRLYFHGHSVGGTNPSLLEAMAGEALICAHDNAFNRSVLGEQAFYFRNHRDVCQVIGQSPDRQQADRWKAVNRQKIIDKYQWDRIIDDYERLFLSM